MVLAKVVHATGTPDDGSIVAVISSTVPELLEAQVTTEEPGYSYTLLDTDLSVDVLQTRYHLQGGLLRDKTQVTILATPAAFPADGVTECQITVSPFLPCLLRVNQTRALLTTTDRILTLTSDTPMQFQIAVQPRGRVWAVPLIVEAL